MPKLSKNFFNEKVLKLLRNNKIYSVNDFLQADIEKLISCELTEKEIIELTPKLISYYSAQQWDGYTLYKYLLRETTIIKTFITGLDELLNGGLLTGSIVEICGLSGSGKTQVCLSISVNVAAKEKYNVTYIDTKKDFRPSRLLQILKTPLLEDPDIILERINCIYVDDIYMLITTLHNIKNNAFTDGNLGKLIILDSLPTLFLPFIGLTSSEGISLLNHIASLLKRIAIEQHVVIILTNLGSKYEDNLDTIKFDELKSNDDIDIRPALGKYWVHVPNTRIIIKKENGVTSQRTLVITKSDYIKLGNYCNIDILECEL